ncbi:rhodanese-like domain-containing protein [Aquimarina sp. 2201CG14-23]|uniref:rhodanese-like domain-containing protein n=1 Tax=Aquimarina mycalae TaxID=3040073 RepID=UPI002477DC86|nr:rhodanese-like domain-containing protein [Aquimarina sp. 2201CG14-23]MDH7445342.1 rhodanese-like domain-containing protein [Aquimarina sp. 2201CG14-23]
MKIIRITLFTLFIPLVAMSQENKELQQSKVDYESFLEISEEVHNYRESRLIPLEQFLGFSKDSSTILLDTRSEKAYRKKHLKGAVHLNFSDFTEGKLAKLIPNKETRILIYCNNNIDGDSINFATKMIPLALNIPTFINLYGYGYHNIYELSSLVPIQDNRLEFTGTEVE